MQNVFENLQHILAVQVKTRRKALDLSQEDLARVAGIDRTYVSQIERACNNPSLMILWRLAAIFKTDVASLLTAPKWE